MNKQEVIEKIEASQSPFISEQDITFNYALAIALNIIIGFALTPKHSQKHGSLAMKLRKRSCIGYVVLKGMQ